MVQSKTVAKTKRQKQRFTIHMNNAPIHKFNLAKSFISSHGLYMRKRPPYLSEISQCGFFLFGYFKNKIIGKAFATKEDLVSWIEEQISEIPRSQLEKVFEEWLKILE